MKKCKKDSLTQWRKRMIKEITKDYDFGENYTHQKCVMENRKIQLNKFRREVQKWELNQVQDVYYLLKDKRKIGSDDFSNKFNQVIYPLLDYKERNQDVDKICESLYLAVCERMSEEGSEFGLW